MAAAACSRRRCPGPRLPSGWKNSSGLAPRQAPCRCHRHFSVDDPGRPRRSAMGTSRRVVTTVIAPEVVRPPTRREVVDRPGWSSPTGVAWRTHPAALRRGGSPGSRPDPGSGESRLLMRNRPSGALGAGRGSPARLGNAHPTGGAVTPLFRAAWRLPGPTSGRALARVSRRPRGEASLVPGRRVSWR